VVQDADVKVSIVRRFRGPEASWCRAPSGERSVEPMPLMTANMTAKPAVISGATEQSRNGDACDRIRADVGGRLPTGSLQNRLRAWRAEDCVSCVLIYVSGVFGDVLVDPIGQFMGSPLT